MHGHFLVAHFTVFISGEVLIIFVVFHLIISSFPRLLGCLGKVYLLATSASSALDDIISGDRLEIVVVFVIIIF